MSTTGDTLFFVDDDPNARRSVEALALSIGIPCESFASAEQLLESFDISRPGCLLLDLQLGSMNGLELQRKLTDMGCNLPVILISGHADVAIAVRAMREGAIRFVQKPYKNNELVDAIWEAMRAYRRKREACDRRTRIVERLGSLSSTEHRVLHLMMTGTENAVIAERLGTDRSTVDRLRAGVLEKMGAEDTIDVARMVSEVGDASNTTQQADWQHPKWTGN